jgi:hypothetical protein
MLPSCLTVLSTSDVMFSKSRTSQARARALPPASWISLATVLMVDCDEFGSGGKGVALEASEVVFAETTTVDVTTMNQ